jgi:hypothetical protein
MAVVVAIYKWSAARAASAPLAAPFAQRSPAPTTPPAPATQPASTAPSAAPLVYLLTITEDRKAGFVWTRRATLPADWESHNCRGEQIEVHPAKGDANTPTRFTVEHAPGGTIEFDLASDLTDVYSRLTLHKSANGYEGTLRAFGLLSIRNDEPDVTGKATLVRMRP